MIGKARVLFGVVLAAFVTVAAGNGQAPKGAAGKTEYRLVYGVADAGVAPDVAKVLLRRVRSMDPKAQVKVVGDRILVLAPGVRTASARKRLKRLLASVGKLEFRLVAMPADTRLGDPGGMETKERARRKKLGKAYEGPPPGYRWVPVAHPAKEQPRDRLLVVPEKAPATKGHHKKVMSEEVFTGADLDPAKLGIAIDAQGAGWVVRFAMKGSRQAAFAAFTRRNLKRQLAIVLDGRILTAPTIQSPLSGSAQITGGGSGFSKQQVTNLVEELRSGALKVPVRLIAESGKDAGK